jgi:hypothetical protein
MKRQNIPTASKFTVLRQVCNCIPPPLVPKLARETGVDEKARTFEEWSHLLSLCYAQLPHSLGLNDVCDALQLNTGPLSALRGATPPTRNNLSPANQARDEREYLHRTCSDIKRQQDRFGFHNELRPSAACPWITGAGNEKGLKSR